MDKMLSDMKVSFEIMPDGKSMYLTVTSRDTPLTLTDISYVFDNVVDRLSNKEQKKKKNETEN